MTNETSPTDEESTTADEQPEAPSGSASGLQKNVAVVMAFLAAVSARLVLWGKAVYAWNLLMAHTIWTWTCRGSRAVWRGVVRAAQWIRELLKKAAYNLPSWETIWRFVTGCLVAVRNGARRCWRWIATGVTAGAVAVSAFWQEKQAALQENRRTRAAEREEQRAARAEATRAKVTELAEKAKQEAAENVERAKAVEEGAPSVASAPAESVASSSVTPSRTATRDDEPEVESPATSTTTRSPGTDDVWRFEPGIDLPTRIWSTILVVLGAGVMEWFGVMNPVRGQFREAPQWSWWYFGITLSVLVPTIWAVRAGAKRNGKEVVAWALVLGLVAGLNLGVNSWVNGRWPV